MNLQHYFLITWPLSQIVMGEEWFSECSLADPEQFGNAAYFVPLEYKSKFIEIVNMFK